MSAPRHAMTLLVSCILAGHVVLTALDNLPDTKVSLGTRLPWLRKIPQWRFFAPNPGVEDLHVMYRTRSDHDWTKWSELALAKPSRIYSPVWNPAGRAAKALFDTAHQLRTLAGFGSSFEWALGSEGYALISDVVRSHCSVKTPSAAEFQFMILAAVPGDDEGGLKPIMVSPPAVVRHQRLDELAPTWT